jgi:uncharacterized protein YcaQ
MTGLEMILVGTVCLLMGLALGGWWGYLCARASQKERLLLTEVIINMKKQGFVRQFEFEQRSIPDPSHDIDES